MHLSFCLYVILLHSARGPITLAKVARGTTYKVCHHGVPTKPVTYKVFQLIQIQGVSSVPTKPVVLGVGRALSVKVTDTRRLCTPTNPPGALCIKNEFAPILQTTVPKTEHSHGEANTVTQSLGQFQATGSERCRRSLCLSGWHYEMLDEFGISRDREMEHRIRG